jgi:uncharacterized membrane protein YfcA
LAVVGGVVGGRLAVFLANSIGQAFFTSLFIDTFLALSRLCVREAAKRRQERRRRSPNVFIEPPALQIRRKNRFNKKAIIDLQKAGPVACFQKKTWWTRWTWRT